MNALKFEHLLIDIDACEPAQRWCKGKTWQEAFNTCQRGDWMLWLFSIINSDDVKSLTLAKAHCAATVIHLMKDERSINAVKVAIAFGEGKSTRTELDTAAADAYAAYASSAASAANAYATSSAYASAIASTAYDASAADNASSAYAANADIISKTDAQKKNQQETADICRKYLPFEIWNISK